MTTKILEHDRISPTAKLVAYWRQFTDIPFSKEIASLFDVEKVYSELFSQMPIESDFQRLAAPMLELRYKSILHFLQKSEIKQVLEIASGIAMRGLAMTIDKDITYVETDLPGLTTEKVSLLNDLISRCGLKKHKNLFFHDANVLDHEQIKPALNHFDERKPIAIIHEGLFQYLSKEEKAIAAKNIFAVLKKFGGYWLTPDLDTRSDFKNYWVNPHQEKTFAHSIEKVTGRNFERNAFEDDEDVHDFFANLGFTVKSQPQLSEDIILSSTKGVSHLPWKEFLARLRLWVLTIDQ